MFLPFLTYQDVLHQGHTRGPWYIAQLAVDYLWTLDLDPNETIAAWNGELLDLSIVAHRLRFCPATVPMLGTARCDAVRL
jgi:hypothetical protein